MLIINSQGHRETDVGEDALMAECVVCVGAIDIYKDE